MHITSSFFTLIDVIISKESELIIPVQTIISPTMSLFSVNHIYMKPIVPAQFYTYGDFKYSYPFMTDFKSLNLYFQKKLS